MENCRVRDSIYPDYMYNIVLSFQLKELIHSAQLINNVLICLHLNFLTACLVLSPKFSISCLLSLWRAKRDGRTFNKRFNSCQVKLVIQWRRFPYPFSGTRSIIILFKESSGAVSEWMNERKNKETKRFGEGLDEEGWTNLKLYYRRWPLWPFHANHRITPIIQGSANCALISTIPPSFFLSSLLFPLSSWIFLQK